MHICEGFIKLRGTKQTLIIVAGALGTIPVVMMAFKGITIVIVYLFLNQVISKPTENIITEGRGIGSTLWGWVTYPFSWWSSEEVPIPTNLPLFASTTRGPYDNVEIGNRNVTVWCNDHTCTTMKCNKGGCSNVTCNIYDTDLNGECRIYNTVIKPEEPIPTEHQSGVEEGTEQSSTIKDTTAMVVPVEKDKIQVAEEHPLELEAVLSSTVSEENKKNNQDNKHIKENSSPQNKV